MSSAVVDLTASSPPTSKPMDISPRRRSSLKRAIDDAPINILRQTLHAICEDPVIATSTACHFMSIMDKISAKESDEESDEDSSEEEDQEFEKAVEATREKNVVASRSHITTNTVLQSRVRPRPAVCKYCLEDFDANAKREKDECVTHPGDKEADYESDIWCDWDERCHGDIEDQGDAFPEGFIYSCCEKAGDSEGCRVGRHKEHVGSGRPYKRVRC